jgi:hypothetical protein
MHSKLYSHEYDIEADRQLDMLTRPEKQQKRRMTHRRCFVHLNPLA